MEYHWPGNVRELSNVLERARLISMDKSEISIEDLPHSMARIPQGAGQKRRSFTEAELRLDNMEKEHIERVLKIAGGNKSKAARLLGISRKNLYQKIEAYS